jgi:hypothetical protein
VKFSRAVRPCCGHSVETSYDGYCTLLTCGCICRQHCLHRSVSVPFEARLDERANRPIYGWCRDCRVELGDAFIRKLRPQRDGSSIYWLGGDADSSAELEAIAAASARAKERVASATDRQLSLFWQ